MHVSQETHTHKSVAGSSTVVFLWNVELLPIMIKGFSNCGNQLLKSNLKAFFRREAFPPHSPDSGPGPCCLKGCKA